MLGMVMTTILFGGQAMIAVGAESPGPDVPLSLSGDAGLDYVDLAWYQPSQGSDGLENYSIYRGSSVGEMVLVTNVTINVTAFHDGSLEQGSTNYYYVTAWYNGTESAPSNALSLTTDQAPEKDNILTLGVVVAIVISAIALQLGVLAVWVLVRKGSK
jgi:fibronectin type 3 domain-containing protein